MTPRKKDVFSAVTATADTAAEETASALRQSTQLERIPQPARFVLVVLSSLALSAGFFSLTSGATLGELGDVSRHLEAWWEVGGLTVWKAVEVGLTWVLGFDGRDVLSFFFLTHLPTYALLASFYNIRPTTVLISCGITLFSTSVPFILLRKPTSVHDLSHAPSGAVSNRSILQDRATTIYTTVAATSILTVVLYLSYATWLPAQLVLHFVNIPDISTVHAGPAGLPTLFVALLPAGWAARDFLFVSSAGAVASKKTDTTEKKFVSHEGEYLVCGVYRQTWGRLSPKTRILASRTVLLAVVLVSNTIVQLAGTVEGISMKGASIWGSVWAVAIFAVGLTFGWIEGVDGV
ncbi:hypothetical protein BDV28DRAFT_139595 [Aspergillus coremiiformis]|uniref:Uncharacterized protein n=1 Tax=Aspergillus coremiiformis TaxID=138285 RepID=A0A5N6YZ20_9EURO|nr:hypothetical protein BDV28DRAFT_139595 [Aspergillus coremiiformis]